MNRESWLTEVAGCLEPWFKRADYVIGKGKTKYRVTCGFPSSGGASRVRRTVGQCHAAESSKGGFYEIFISPVLADPVEVAGTLAHELAHIVAGVGEGHKGPFLRVRKAVNLTAGKPTNAMPGELLTEEIKRILSCVGEYPHQQLDVASLTKKQSTRLLKVECSCGCVARMTKKWLEEVGPPTCGCGQAMQASG